MAGLLLTPLLQITTTPAAKASIVSGGLLARWNSKDASSYSSGTTWNDISGNGRNATLYNSATTSALTQVNSQKAPAMTFDNSNIASGTPGTFPTSGKYAALASGLALGAMTKFSISFTANFGTASGTGWDRIIDFGNGAASDNILVGRNGTSTTLAIEVWQGGTSSGQCNDPSAITNNTWAHYTIVLNGSTCKFYINSVLHNSYSYTCLLYTSPSPRDCS